MTTLTVTTKGQVTLRKDLLKHLGVAPGDKVSIDLMPDGKATLLRREGQGN
jgi:AbrB family looped-hinge helix DNA binding protein